MCRTYGAPDFYCNDAQAFWPGLAFAAPYRWQGLWVKRDLTRVFVGYEEWSRPQLTR